MRARNPVGVTPHGLSCLLKHRTEYIRLLEQSLGSLGFSDVAAALQHESGVALEPATVGQLRAAVNGGAFDKAVSLVAQLPLGSSADTKQAQFLLLEQKFLEVC